MPLPGLHQGLRLARRGWRFQGHVAVSPIKVGLRGFQATVRPSPGLLRDSPSPSPTPRLPFSLSPDSLTSKMFGLVENEMRAIYNEIISILSNNLRSPELIDMNRYYFELLDTKLGITNAGIIFVVKALNHHIRQDPTLQPNQIKVLAIIELLTSYFIHRDDYVDDAKTRRNALPVYRKWDAKRTAFSCSAMLACCLTEANKLHPKVVSSLLLMFANANKSLLMPELPDFMGKDVDINVSTALYLGNGSAASNLFLAIAAASNAGVVLEEMMKEFGYNVGMAIGLMDEIKDLRVDLEGGLLTTPMLFAMESNPSLREMFGKKYKEKEDIGRMEKLVRDIGGVEKTTKLMMTYFRNTLRYLYFLADSEYKTVMLTSMELGLSFMNKPFEESKHTLDFLGAEGF